MKNFETKLKPISSVRYVSRRKYHLPFQVFDMSADVSITYHYCIMLQKNTWMQNLRGQMAARARHLSTL